MTATRRAIAKRLNYPAYKDSGVTWFDEVPVDWLVKRLKTVAAYTVSNVDKVPAAEEIPIRLCNYTDVYYNERIHPDMSLMETTATADEIGRFGLRVGDVLITKDSEHWSDIAVPALVEVTASNLVCGYHLAIVRPDRRELLGPYLLRVFQASAINQQFQVASNGITRYGLPKSAIGEAWLPVPPLPEQHAIAAFLDRETATIHSLVAKKERLIALLQEKRAAIISHAVTRGLDPDAPLKDSGVAWLGQVPEHWDILQLRRVVSKFVDYRGATPEKVPSGVPLVTAKNIKNGQIDFTLSEEFIRESAYDGWMVRGLPEVGDVLVTTEAPLGETAQISDPNIALAQRLILLKRNRAKMTNDFLRLFITSIHGQAELWSRATGSTALGIKASHLKEIFVIAPPVEEQHTITNFLVREINKIDALVAKVREHIAVLREHRTALISAAVTGRIDVRGEVGL